MKEADAEGSPRLLLSPPSSPPSLVANESNQSPLTAAAAGVVAGPAAPDDAPPDESSSNSKGKRPVLDPSGGTRPSTLHTPPHGRNITPQERPNRLATPKLLGRAHHRKVLGAKPGPRVPESFSAYKAIIRHNTLFFKFAAQLSIDTMVDLYAIDKEFHYRFNMYNTSLLNIFTSTLCPVAAPIFSWTLFPSVTISDPMLRPMDNRPHLARDVPSLRWTRLVLWRSHVVRCILTMLALNGHRVPSRTAQAVMKFWVAMERPTTRERVTLLKDKSIWSDTDIYLFTLFRVKLDMYFNDPMNGRASIAQSHMLLTQKSLTPLYDIMRGAGYTRHECRSWDTDDASDMLTRTYLARDLALDRNHWLYDEWTTGVPRREMGLLSRENWWPYGAPMPSAVDLLTREAHDRGLSLERYVVDFVTYGFVDGKTGENVGIPRKMRYEKVMKVPREVWLGEAVRVGMIERVDGKFGIEKGEGKGVVRESAKRDEWGKWVPVWRWEDRVKATEGEEAADREEMEVDG